MRHIRNFWLTARVDGCRRSWSGGPRSACGGFVLELRCRDRGAVGRPIRLIGRRLHDRLVLDLEQDGVRVFHTEFER